MRFGAFGKIPAVGDFFRISAPAGFVQRWDDWIQRCLVSGAMTFGDAWDGLYMSAPIWRFTLAPDVVGENAIMGVLMPSVDRVGRRFPLTLMAEISNSAQPILSHFGNTPVFEALETLALGALEDDATRDGLDESLAGLRPDAIEPQAYSRDGGRAFLVQHDGDPQLSAAVFASAAMQRGFSKTSVWSAVLDGDTRVMVCEGLPDGLNMQVLFETDSDYWKDSRL